MQVEQTLLIRQGQVVQIHQDFLQQRQAVAVVVALLRMVFLEVLVVVVVQLQTL